MSTGGDEDEGEGEGVPRMGLDLGSGVDWTTFRPSHLASLASGPFFRPKSRPPDHPMPDFDESYMLATLDAIRETAGEAPADWFAAKIRQEAWRRAERSRTIGRIIASCFDLYRGLLLPEHAFHDLRRWLLDLPEIMRGLRISFARPYDPIGRILFELSLTINNRDVAVQGQLPQQGGYDAGRTLQDCYRRLEAMIGTNTDRV